MSTVVHCEDGIEVEIESSKGLWVLIRAKNHGKTLGRFPIDPSELRATLAGNFSFHATDGAGNSVSFDENAGKLNVRLEGDGLPPKQCRLSLSDIKTSMKSLGIDV